MMQLLTFIEQEARESAKQVLMITTISGVANSLLLGIINHASEAIAQHESLSQYFLLYLLTFALFLYGQWYAFDRAILMIEEAIYRTRLRLAQKVQHVELPFMETMHSHQLYARLTQNDALISQAIPQLVGAFQMFILLICALFYLGYLSVLGFIITLVAMGIATVLFLAQSKRVKKSLQRVQKKEEYYFQAIAHLVNGFKEVKINRQKGDELCQHIASVSRHTQDIKAVVRQQEARLWGFGRLFIYALLPILIFILPTVSQLNVGDIFKISSTLLFLIGPTTTVVNILPLLNRVNVALQDLQELEQLMDEAIAASTQPSNKPTTLPDDQTDIANFHTLTMQAVTFSYPDQPHGFSAGAFNEQIKQGELLFIIGGNGSGKSTFLKLLTGLYYPVTGQLMLDNKAIDPASYTTYRQLFSTVFTDFYLFDQLYGVTEENKEKVGYWLEKMQLQHKVSYQPSGFTTTNLSTGQRKRLALIAALLEDKPILVLDEFAADQDPQFRQYFYETLLAEIKAMGKTIIAVTHDDHYFHVADRVLKMDEGRLLKY